MPDISISDHGSIWLFRPISEEAKAFFDENVASEPWQWLGGALGVEARYAGGLAFDLVNEHGFEVE